MTIAHKYRPQKFSDFIGNDLNITLVKNAVKLDRIPNAYLFAGMQGTGKTSLARVLAKAVNCEHPINGEPCNTCNSCTSITKTTHPDVFEIDATSNSGVDSARELAREAYYSPKYSKYKIYIIDECHGLSNQAWDALLTCLEELSKYILFIFCTTELYKIKSTIQSRCQLLKFLPVPYDVITNHLEMISDKENLGLSHQVLKKISFKCSGEIRSALNLMEQAYLLKDDAFALNTLLKRLCADDIKQYLNLVSNNKIQEALAYVKQIDFRIPDILDGLSAYLSMCLIKKKKIPGILKVQTLKEVLDIVVDTKLKINKQLSPKISFEILTFELSRKLKENNEI